MRFVLLALALGSSCAAATFYVSPTGLDTNAGTPNSPWLTLQYAVDTIQPGDTIIVQSGTYVGCRIGNPGTPRLPKTLKGAPNAHVLVNAPGPDNRHGSNIEVENFNLTMSDWIIDGLEVANAPLYGIDVRVTTRITVQNTKVHDSRLTGIFTGFSDHVLIQGNETYNNGEHGIYQSNSSVYPVIRLNRSHNNAASGIHMNGDLSEGPPGIIQYALVELNTIWENGTIGGSGINCDGVDNSIIRLNRLINNHASGISLYGIDAVHSSSYNQVYSNTIVMAPNSRDVMNIPDDGAVAPPVGNVIQMNVLCTPDQGNVSVITWEAHVPGFVSDQNVVEDRFSADNDNTIIPLPQWRQLGYDKRSVLGCGVFRNTPSPQ